MSKTFYFYKLIEIFSKNTINLKDYFQSIILSKDIAVVINKTINIYKSFERDY